MYTVIFFVFVCFVLAPLFQLLVSMLTGEEILTSKALSSIRWNVRCEIIVGGFNFSFILALLYRMVFLFINFQEWHFRIISRIFGVAYYY